MARKFSIILLSSCLLLLSSQVLLGDPPPTYYDTVDTTDGASLRATLHDIIDDHTRFPYTSSATDTWDILESADEDPGNASNILDLYKNTSIPKFGGGVGPYQREHTWPKSYGFPDDNVQNYPYTDCHHLFLCDGSYNGSRSNKPYRNCNAACTEKPTEFNNGQGGGSGTYPGNSNWTEGSYTAGTWETWIGRRGDVARAQFYMDVRYEGGTHGVTGASEPDLILTDNETLIASGNTGNNESTAYMGMMSVLLQWHVQDPVDDVERTRNDVVFSDQGNRNPFIDHPEWVECVFNNINCGGDATAPVFGYCPGSVSFGAENASGLPLSSPNWIDFVDSISASVSDDVDPSPIVSHNAPDPLPINSLGTSTNVVFTATDASSYMATCEVDVYVYQPADIVMVLDDTGSMQQSTGDGTGNSKIESLRYSVDMFTDILGEFRQNLGDMIGAVTFKVPPGGDWTLPCQSAWAQDLVTFGALNSTILGIIDTNVNTAMPADGWATPIRAGIEDGSATLNAQEAWRRRLMVLLSDGMQNTPNCLIGPDAAGIAQFKQDQITDRDINLLAVGFGAASQIDADLLEELALSANGFYDTAESTVALNKWFAETLSVILEQTFVIDPQGSIAPGATDTVNMQLTSQSRSAMFLLAWAREQTDLDLILQTPGPDPVIVDFSKYLRPHNGITTLQGPTYKVIIARFPLGSELKGKHAGTWKALLSRSQANAGPEEPYTFMVLADSPLQILPVIPDVHLATGDRFPLLVDLAGVGLTEAKVIAEVSFPKQGLGTKLAAMKLTDKDVEAKTADLMHDYNMLARRITLLRQAQTEPVAKDVHTVTLYDDGKHGDRRARDGTFGGTFGPLPLDGSYSVMYRAVGTTAKGERFQREFRRGIYVPPKLSPGKTDVRIIPPQAGGRVFAVTLTPRDVNGLLLGPGHVDSISFALVGASAGRAIDNGDGSYKVEVTLEADSSQVDIVVSGATLRSLLLTTALQPILPIPGFPWQWISVLLVLVVFALLYILLRCRKSSA